MKKNTVSLKITIVIMGLLGLCVYFWALPHIGSFIRAAAPEYSKAYYPWLIVFWITAIPCYATLCLLWQVVKSIDENQLFKTKNANRFKIISILVFIDVAIFMAANILYLFFNINHPSVVIASAFVCVIGVAFGISMRALSEFFNRAATLQEENDLTI